ncbi:hypothetical protein CVT25_009451 [Psilocybe cyanescens]|uniref:Uncharacterized protein n=1 Tax=Psilocybe cyanescens TaxID=93625 RepID=A0A409XGN8_PSICY|nr:hypothetical protein CVT25_009451 [Psilocybe cyanescens]
MVVDANGLHITIIFALTIHSTAKTENSEKPSTSKSIVNVNTKHGADFGLAFPQRNDCGPYYVHSVRIYPVSTAAQRSYCLYRINPGGAHAKSPPNRSLLTLQPHRISELGQRAHTNLRV